MTGAGFNFTGRRVLVTGASHGIGRAVAAAFARARARLTVLSSTGDVLAAADEIAAETGADVTGVVCDIADRAGVRDIFGRLDGIDVLVNNAGLERRTPVLDPGDEVDELFERIVRINIVGTWNVTRAALPRMPAGSSIVVTASVWGKTGAAEFAAYVASKHANIGFMRVLARELGPRGVRVNAVCPGWVRTRAAMLAGRGLGARGRLGGGDAGRDPVRPGAARPYGSR
jgi:3-hydroxybutyrate dehydrogenase